MLVFAFTKIPDHPSKDPNRGARKGDISSFHPLDYEFSKEELKFFLPVVVELKIPCDEYGKQPCRKCQHNNPESCDAIKYIKGLWSTGTVFQEPKLLMKRKYNIDRSKFLSADSELLITKENKTLEERNAIISNAKKNPQVAGIITEKIWRT